jgi:hypothetical protein
MESLGLEVMQQPFYVLLVKVSPEASPYFKDRKMEGAAKSHCRQRVMNTLIHF